MPIEDLRLHSCQRNIYRISAVTGTIPDLKKYSSERQSILSLESVEMPMPEKKVVRDKGHEGVTPHQDFEMDAAKDANLNEADVVVLRLVTGTSRVVDVLQVQDCLLLLCCVVPLI
jgi:hypothetical protein